MCTIVDCRSSQLGSATMPRCSAAMLRCLAPLLRYQAVWSPPIFTACVCDLCRVRVLVRLSHPRPPDSSQHGCTVGVLPGPTRVLPMPRQCGIGRRAPTRAVLSCAALWCLVVRRPRRRVDCLVLTFVGFPLKKRKLSKKKFFSKKKSKRKIFKKGPKKEKLEKKTKKVT